MADKFAPTDIHIHPLIAGRWSPRAYADRPVSPDDVRALVQAARWAPSAFNGQPWRFLILEKGTNAVAFDRGFRTLVPFNQSWNKNAQVLIVVLADTLNFKGDVNRTAHYDAGASALALLLEAHARGLAAHSMSGFDAPALLAGFGIDKRYVPLAMISVAHHGDPGDLPVDLGERERAPRQRRPLGEIAHFGKWTNEGEI
ncbi:Oxidoreductase [Burkholderia sp. 8Y]|uniref:nitroreductase family protein n=1 Tax=Burkholderia sp. 8Y TaxID=2653133 RepID=UPI0012F01AB9|nr:nitroreductase family protein [Burkholderia sp. 8Y]VXC92329.1 Oxidoreductase [Burkholderia sp. 8Y]